MHALCACNPQCSAAPQCVPLLLTCTKLIRVQVPPPPPPTHTSMQCCTMMCISLYSPALNTYTCMCTHPHPHPHPLPTPHLNVVLHHDAPLLRTQTHFLKVPAILQTEKQCCSVDLHASQAVTHYDGRGFALCTIALCTVPIALSVVPTALFVK
jgi:hypothetical protein